MHIEQVRKQVINLIDDEQLALAASFLCESVENDEDRLHICAYIAGYLHNKREIFSSFLQAYNLIKGEFKCIS